MRTMSGKNTHISRISNSVTHLSSYTNTAIANIARNSTPYQIFPCHVSISPCRYCCPECRYHCTEHHFGERWSSCFVYTFYSKMYNKKNIYSLGDIMPVCKVCLICEDLRWLVLSNFYTYQRSWWPILADFMFYSYQ